MSEIDTPNPKAIKDPDLTELGKPRQRARRSDVGKPRGPRKKKTVDPMASLAPAHILAERDAEKGQSKVEVGVTRYPVNRRRLMLDHTLYVNPDPGKDYRFGSRRYDRLVGNNKNMGFEPEKDSSGREIVVAGMQLLSRPKEVSEWSRKEKEAEALAQAHRISAQQVAAEEALKAGLPRNLTTQNEVVRR